MTALMPAVLDTDVLSAVMRKNPIVRPKARAYLAQHGLGVITNNEKHFGRIRDLRIDNWLEETNNGN